MCLHGGISVLRKMPRSSSDIYNLMHIILSFEHIHARQNLFFNRNPDQQRDNEKSNRYIESKS